MAKFKSRINVGDSVKDKLTGFEGIVTGVHFWLTGCCTATVGPRDLKDGVPLASQSFDAPRLEVLETGAVVLESKAPDNPKRTGGPKPTPARNRG